MSTTKPGSFTTSLITAPSSLLLIVRFMASIKTTSKPSLSRMMMNRATHGRVLLPFVVIGKVDITFGIAATGYYVSLSIGTGSQQHCNQEPLHVFFSFTP